MKTNIGDLNKKAGWLILALTMPIGFILHFLMMPDNYGLNPSTGEDLSNLRLVTIAYTEALFLSLINMFYGFYIDRTSLSDMTKTIGSRLTLFGSVIYPGATLLQGLLPFEPIRVVASIGGMMAMIGIAIITIGVVFKSN